MSRRYDVNEYPYVDTVETAEISATGSGAKTLVAAPGAGKRLRVHHVSFTVGAATEAALLWGSTRKGAWDLPAGGGLVLDIPQNAPMLLPENTALVLSLTNAAALKGMVRWEEVPA